ncbi:hypothetical protein [Mycoplasmopsis cynos]|uniref:hypothetical protein n=1 Tax=Mycoplasmopsis cynos TaxID=171284 RepID=UPI0024C99503|nr:hypothetical protein [Mycoplasmopsis cynos]WAM08066.1 hypothetical protein ONA21_01830 [Mycoplasmopsis cynos]
MKTKKLTLKTKTLLSLGIISALSISAIGGMFAYAKNSDEVNGSYSHLSLTWFKKWFFIYTWYKW